MRCGLTSVRFLAVVLACLALGLPGKAFSGTLKVGIIAPLSGPGAPWGKALADGVELAVQALEEKGGLKINGEKQSIELIPYDDKYTGAGGVQAANRLISVDNAKFIFGSIGSAVVMAFTPITEKEKVLVIGNSYSRRAITAETDYFWRAAPTSTEASPLLIPYVVKKENVKTVALIGPNDESGQDLTKTDVEEYQKLNVKVVYNEFYERAQKDFYPQMTKIMSLNPDLIDVSASAPGTTGLLVKQARDLGFKGRFVTPSGFFPPPVIEAAGKAADGFYYAIAADLSSTDPKIQAIKEKYKKRYNRECDQWSVINWYGAAELLFRLMAEKNSIDPAVIKKAMENLGTFDGITGKSFFYGKDVYGANRQLMSPIWICVLQDSQEKILEKVSK